MPVLAHAVVSKQADVILQLGTTNLADLAEDELFWRPAASSWSVTSAGDRWVADWVEPEPADLAPPTLAWQLWHASWWLSMVLDHSFGTGTLTRAAFRWEGPAADSNRSSSSTTAVPHQRGPETPGTHPFVEHGLREARAS